MKNKIEEFANIKLNKNTNVFNVVSFSLEIDKVLVCNYTADEYDDAVMDYEDAKTNIAKGLPKSELIMKEEVLIGKQLTN